MKFIFEIIFRIYRVQYQNSEIKPIALAAMFTIAYKEPLL